MLSNSVAYPEELTVMTQALDDYCRAKGIASGTPEFEAAGQEVVALFAMGWRTKEDLTLVLENRRRN